MSTCIIRKVVTATAAILALTLFLPAPASAQMPANCNANLLDESISRDPSAPTALAGDVINYTVIVVNRIILPSGCNPADPNNLCTGNQTPLCAAPASTPARANVR
jgi:hypothetical protein